MRVCLRHLDCEHIRSHSSDLFRLIISRMLIIHSVCACACGLTQPVSSVVSTMMYAYILHIRHSDCEHIRRYSSDLFGLLGCKC